MSRVALDVAVIGGGLAGLAAAHALAREQLSVTVFEATGRAGGRVHSVPAGEHWLELGAQFVGPGHRHFQALAQKLRVGLSPSGLSPGSGLLPARWVTSGAPPKVGKLPPLQVLAAVRLARSLAKLSKLAKQVPPESPWSAPDAARLDAQSFSQWLQADGVDRTGRELLEGLVQGFASARARDVSLLQILWWIARSGGPLAALVDGFGQYVTGGTQLLIERFLAEPGVRLRLNRPVHSLVQAHERVSVTFLDNREELAHRAIVTAPNPAASRILFRPELPEAQAKVLRELRFGSASKVVALAPDGPRTRFALDAPGGELGWARGRTLSLLTLEDRPDPVQQVRLGTAFGLERERLQDATVQRWSKERYIGGTFALFRPGQLTTLGPSLARPHGDVYFAGAERSSWPNSMEGALESGLHVAVQVADSLGVQMRCEVCGYRAD